MIYIIMSVLESREATNEKVKTESTNDEWLKNRQAQFFREQAVEKTINPELKAKINEIRLHEGWINEYLVNHNLPTRPEAVGMYLKLVEENCTKYAEFIPFMDRVIEITNALEKMLPDASPPKVGMYLKLVLGSKD